MWFFKKKERSSVVLISIGSSTVAGAYAHYTEGEPPTLYYTTSRPVTTREGEDLKSGMLRALDAVGTDLIETGAPALRRETGSGRVDEVLVSVAGPWQETTVRTETVQPGKQFTFTHAMLSEIVASSSHVAKDRVSFGESVIATILNGYDTPNAIGKQAKRAEVVILSSTLEKDVTEEVRSRLRRLYHTHTIQFTAFAPVAYAVLHDLYPHERDFLILDVESEGTDLVFVKGGLLVDVGTLSQGTRSLLGTTRSEERMTVEEEKTAIVPGYVNPRSNTSREDWLKDLAAILKKFAELHTLPRTFFVLTDPSSREQMKRVLDTKILHELWHSDESLCVIPLSPDLFASKVRARGAADTNLFLSILALYYVKGDRF